MKISAFFLLNFLYIVFILFQQVESLCKFTQTESKGLIIPVNNTEPFLLDEKDLACPDYVGKKVCCSAAQNIDLRDNFNSLDIVFGSGYGGCDICSINLKRFWCAFTCDPEQHLFGR
jgi:hypothetical protein